MSKKPQGSGTAHARRARRVAAKREMLKGCSMNEAAKRVRKRFGLGVCFATLKELETEIRRERKQGKGKAAKLPSLDRYLKQVHQDMLALGVSRLVLDETGRWEVTRTEGGDL